MIQEITVSKKKLYHRVAGSKAPVVKACIISLTVFEAQGALSSKLDLLLTEGFVFQNAGEQLSSLKNVFSIHAGEQLSSDKPPSYACVVCRQSRIYKAPGASCIMQMVRVSGACIEKTFYREHFL